MSITITLASQNSITIILQFTCKFVINYNYKLRLPIPGLHVIHFWQDAVKIMAKDLVRTRNFVKRFILMRANIQAVSLKLQTLRSQAAMANAMKGVSKALKSMNSKVCFVYLIFVLLYVCLLIDEFSQDSVNSLRSDLKRVL